VRRMSWGRRTTGYDGDDHWRDGDGKLYKLPRNARSVYGLRNLSCMAYRVSFHNTPGSLVLRSWGRYLFDSSSVSMTVLFSY